MIQTKPEAKVLMVSMPFGPLNMPSIGLSLLQASLKAGGVESQCLYLTIPFAQTIGVDLYNDITSGKPDSADMLGEWIFADTLSPGLTADPERYLRDVLHSGNKNSADVDAFFAKALEARAHASPFIERCMKEIPWRQFSVIGFTSIFQQNVASLALAKRVKVAYPEVTIVFGGANAEGVMGLELLRNFPFVDAIVSGEGDVAFPLLIENLLHGRPIEELQGVFTQKNCRKQFPPNTRLTAPSPKAMDDLPLLDYDDYFHQLRSSGLEKSLDVHLLFESSRGCWWGQKSHCTFCGLNSSNMTFRAKSQERALSELQGLIERYPGFQVSVVDNILDMTYFQKFLPALRDSGSKTDLFYEVKANLRKDQLQLMRSAGITTIQPGIESLSTPVLKLMRKGTTALQNIQLLKWCKELNIDPYWNILWGFPGEDPAEYEKMARWIPALTHLPAPGSTAQIRLDRFSPNFDQAATHGFNNVRSRSSYAHIYPTLDERSRHEIAYYFAFDYADHRDPARYVVSLQEGVQHWKDVSGNSELIQIELPDGLLIWDQRGDNFPRIWVLKGLAKTILEQCDKIQNLSAIEAAVKDALGQEASGESRAAIDALVDSGLLIEEKGNYLGLVVKFGNYALPAPALKRIGSALDEIGQGQMELKPIAPGLFRAQAAIAESVYAQA